MAEPDAARVARHRVTGLAALVGALPIVAVLLRFAGSRVTLAGDQAIFAMQAGDAATGGFPTVGLYSRYGWNHPGPIAFYLFAPFQWIGATWGILIGAAAWNTAALGTAVWLAARRGGSTLVASSSLPSAPHGCRSGARRSWTRGPRTSLLRSSFRCSSPPGAPRSAMSHPSSRCSSSARSPRSSTSVTGDRDRHRARRAGPRPGSSEAAQPATGAELARPADHVLDRRHPAVRTPRGRICPPSSSGARDRGGRGDRRRRQRCRRRWGDAAWRPGRPIARPGRGPDRRPDRGTSRRQRLRRRRSRIAVLVGGAGRRRRGGSVPRLGLR